MDFLFFLLIFLSLSSSLVSAISFVYPNSTVSGTFLFSSNEKFKAAMFNPGAQRIRFYLCVIHVESNTIIWSANRDSPVSESGSVILTVNGITVSDANGGLKWSTPRLQSLVFALWLTETGNLVLLDRSNVTLWESFRNPTDTIVIGQELHLSTALLSGISSDDLSTGDYKLALTSSDVTLDWKKLVYWKLSMDIKAYVNSNYAVEFMVVNQTGLYLIGQNGSTVVITVSLRPSDFRFAKIDDSGRFIIGSFSGVGPRHDLVVPVDQCCVPSTCGKLGLCNSGVSKDTFVCSCPLGFRLASDNRTDCIPENGSHSLPVSCNSTDGSNSLNSSSIVVSYLQLGYDVDYFANDFNQPVEFGANLSRCQDLCSRDCACFGIFYDNSSGSCYKLENELGSVMSRTTGNGRLGFIKTVVRAPPTNLDDSNHGDNVSFPGAKVLLPLIGVLFVFAVGILLWRRFRFPRVDEGKTNTAGKGKTSYSLSRSHSYSSSCEDLKISIPGLPLRFSYEELMIATTSFKTKIGTGGYGTVYKGIMSDKTPVAVKRLTKLGRQGKKDFCTEIAVIGNIHHVNLVKLKGYCAEREEWLLVYEYMSHGSLDKTLFGSNGPALEWQERVEIAVGTARGLTYLHGGCEPKIIHCDVKPENILLGDRLHAKISDFGLAKFLGLGESSVMATMRGTRGYLAPEWLTRSTISDKTDVYSFGMVLLEIVSGRKNCLSSSDDGIIFFPLHALEMHEQGRYLELVDPRLRGRVTNEDVEKMVRVALCCVHQEPGLRPGMVNVVGMLEGRIPLGEPRVESLTFLRFYGRRFPRVEESEVVEQAVTYSDANVSHSNSSESVSYAGFSNVSSHQISGPR
ncbi:g-type lectin s-receptor-like serine/threonine-protein kinase at5g35370 [Phtheirospermum japonicum]|uniref:Receptor-like serine/threonine-protein kinase n=1 Tax=Phtheirospermum japonicum TaxID=374723 RepID=A0A830BDV0_9LAMI|nr:g-type lectin s-receptor-like serine/threonine-protein kinase at5g35370 [Phtheirospermum japonicum]